MQHNPYPVVLFVYNRPEHTKKTLQSLESNRLADKTHVYIYFDGISPDTSAEEKIKHQNVKDIISLPWKFYKTEIIQREMNFGLARNIREGVSSVLATNEAIIVLEDDIETHPDFLNFMNQALYFYRNEEKVYHVSGYMFPLKQRLPETFFLQLASCWGWGTWKRAWKNFTNLSAFEIKSKLEEEGNLESFNLSKHWSFLDQLNQNIYSKKKTWAVFWYYTIFSNNSFSLHPGYSLTHNLGNDSTGVNSVKTNIYDVKLTVGAPQIKKIPIEEHSEIRRFLKTFPKQDDFDLIILRILRKIFKKLVVEIEKNRIRRIKRFQQFETYIIGKTKTTGVDNLSFLFQHNEIFNRQMYRFHSDVKDPLIIDCGSNIGLSVLFFKKLYPDSRIIAFECDPDIYKVLETNVQNHHLSNVKLHMAAVWDREDILRFEQDGADGGKISSKDGKGAIEVPAVQLKPFLNQKVHFLKLDIEGSEYKVLLDCKANLKNVDHIFLEYHSYFDKNEHLAEILELLQSAGFRYYIDNSGVKSSQPFVKQEVWSGMDNQLNIFAFRR